MKNFIYLSKYLSKPPNSFSEFWEIYISSRQQKYFVEACLMYRSCFCKRLDESVFSLAKKMSFKDFGDIFCGSNSYELGEKKNHE